jgi:deazaflavin-dependent oxidoreductase (nitroreductase family)
MLKQINERKALTGWRRFFFRAPIWLYRWGLGWLLGKRFLLINHIGRKSGLPRQAVVEVLVYDRDHNAYYVAAGFGPESQWYKNLLARPDVTIVVGRQKLAVTAVPLSPPEAGVAILDYARRHPAAIKYLARMVGCEVDGSEADYLALGEQGIIPVVRFDPRHNGANDDVH